MSKFRTISIFLENLNDDPKLVRCSDTLMVQLVKFVTAVTLNVSPIPFKFFASQIAPHEEQRFCQFEFNPSNPGDFKLFYMFELENKTIQVRTFDNSTDYENWDPFNQGTIEPLLPSPFFNFSMISALGNLNDWSYIYSSFGTQEYIDKPQMSVFSSSKNHGGEIISISGISLFTNEIAKLIKNIPCNVMNSSSLPGFTNNTVKSDDNQNAFVKYALLSTKTNTVIIENDIGVVNPLEIVDNFPIYPKLDQLNSSFWSELSQTVFQHKRNEVFKFTFDRVQYLVVQTSVSSIRTETIQESLDKDNSIPSGIINRIINSTDNGNETHIFIACFPIDPSVQSVYYPMSVLFVLGVSILGLAIFVSIYLIKRENLWRIRKIALQTPKFQSTIKSENLKIQNGINTDNIGDDDDASRHYGYIPNSIENIRNFQLEYPDDAILNKTLDNTVEALTLREDQNYVLTRKDQCDFCKYFIPEKIDLQKESNSSTNKKGGRLSRRLSNISHRRSSSNFSDSDDFSGNNYSDSDDVDLNPQVNLNVNIESETDESLYKIWKMVSLPFIQVMPKKKKDDEANTSIYQIRRGKGTKNKFIWEKFPIDQFLEEPQRMLMRYMMTLLNDCQLFFPPFDPMCVANLLITIEKGIRDPVHAAHELFTVHQIVYGPFSYWITNKLDILVLFFAVYFCHFDYRLYTISKNKKNSNNEFNRKDDEDSNSFSSSQPSPAFMSANDNDINITMEGFKAFDDDFSKIEENLKELKSLIQEIFPIRSPPKTEDDYLSRRNDSSLIQSINSSNSDIPDSQSATDTNKNSDASSEPIIPVIIPRKNKEQKKLSSNPPSYQNLKKITVNKRSYSNIVSEDVAPDILMAATTESETDNTETQTTDTITSMSFSVNAIDDEANSENSRSSNIKRRTLPESAKKKKKKVKGPFWYFWKTLKQIMYKICIKSESFELLGKIRVRIQSPSLDIHNDYGDKLLFMESVLKLCDLCAYWSPIEVMEKALGIQDSMLFNIEEISDKLFISSFHLEFCQKAVFPWIKILAIFKPQAFEDVIKNSLNVIEYWTRKKEEAQNATDEMERVPNPIIDVNQLEEPLKKDDSYEDDQIDSDDESSDDSEYNYCDND